MDQIVICKNCRQPEWWGAMHWISGRCICRNCYQAEWERTTGKPYQWNDLEGERPTMEGYRKQEERRE